jgi:hypothetical protein
MWLQFSPNSSMVVFNDSPMDASSWSIDMVINQASRWAFIDLQNHMREIHVVKANDP